MSSQGQVAICPETDFSEIVYNPIPLPTLLSECIAPAFQADGAAEHPSSDDIIQQIFQTLENWRIKSMYGSA